MGRVAAVLEFIRAIRGSVKVSDVKVDRGGGDNRTLEHFADAGDDSFPLPTDYVASIDQDGTGRESAVGYLDPLNAQKATAGDKRIYARDPATGAQVVEVWLKSDGTASTENDNGSSVLAPDGSVTSTSPNGSVTLAADGSITGTNASGSFVLQAGGDFVVNGVTIASTGAVTIPTSLILNSREVAGHAHTQPDTGADATVQGNTGANI